MRYLILLALVVTGIGVFYVFERVQEMRQDDAAVQNAETLRQADVRTVGARTRFAAEQVLSANADKDMSSDVVDRVRVITLLEKAAKEGDARAMGVLGEIYLDKPGFYHNPLMALAWFTRANEKGDPEAAKQLLRLCPGWTAPSHELYLTSEAAQHGNKSATQQIWQTCTWLFKTTAR